MKHEKDVGFWSTFGGVTAHPWRTLGSLAEDQATLRKGLLALVLVLGAYTAILAIFITKGYPAVNPSVLPISVEEHYSVQIWYQGPLFFLTTLATAGFLVLCAYALGQSAGYPLAFARISFATASLGGLIPEPMATAYVTTKHAVVGLSTSLRAEAAELGIKVSVVCPGFVQTGIHDAATYVGAKREDVISEMSSMKMADVTNCARVILRGVERNKAIITDTAFTRLLWWLYRFHPSLLDPFIRKGVSDMRALRIEP